MELTNKKFGNLTVLIKAEGTKRSSWLCRCDCGKEKVVDQNQLQQGKADNCGCKSAQKRIETYFRDLTNQKFNMLTVLKKITDGYVLQRHTYWLCKCECGGEKLVSTHSLKSGNIKSCGCMKLDNTIKFNTKGKVGDKFKRLLIIKIIPLKERIKKNNNCECLCDCGKIIQTQLSRVMSGAAGSCGCLNREISSNNKGPKSARWNPNITDEERFHKRKYKEYYIFRKSVFERDGYKCQICNHKGYNQVHHIINYASFHEGRTDPMNGITLCKKHHNLFHQTYGIYNNTKIQLLEFIEREKFGQ